MMAIRSGAEDMVVYLNKLLALDPEFINTLVTLRPPCNAALVKGSDIQVVSENKKTYCGLLGILNGFYGKFDDARLAGWGIISAITDEDRIIEFTLTDPNDETLEVLSKDSCTLQRGKP